MSPGRTSIPCWSPSSVRTFDSCPRGFPQVRTVVNQAVIVGRNRSMPCDSAWMDEISERYRSITSDGSTSASPCTSRYAVASSFRSREPTRLRDLGRNIASSARVAARQHPDRTLRSIAEERMADFPMRGPMTSTISPRSRRRQRHPRDRSTDGRFRSRCSPRAVMTTLDMFVT